MVNEFASAKINLTLHVTGRRSDGYHLLDSLVVFAGIGDRLAAVPSDASSLTLQGPFGAEVPNGLDNIILRAAALFSPDRGVAMTLQKNLPPASGIGGGSADAAAAIRAIWALQNLPDAPDAKAVLGLGADVPVCLLSQPARMQGIGDKVIPVHCPAGWLTLVNPREEVPTPQVFAGLNSRENPPMPFVLPKWCDVSELALWLHGQRNDLEAPALAVAPVISEVLAALRAEPATLIARMSGSGATCFALSASQAGAEAIAANIRAMHPAWWVAAGPLIAG
jgi:4-diphosphocytidyl-2-C-methyl-D-erythritol kinase